MTEGNDKKKVRKEGTVHVTDADIYYRVVGKGRPVVLLHGNGENHTAFRAQIQDFAGEYQLILIDSRGHGRSSLGYQGLRFPVMANDILQVLNALEVEDPVILGFSDGANLALQFAVLYPERMKALVLVSGNWRPQGMKFWFCQSVKLAYAWWSLAARFHWKARLTHRASRDACPAGGRTFRTSKYNKELYGLMAWQPRLKAEEIKEIKVPVLVMAADKDMIKESHTKQLAGLLPDARLKIVKNANHMSIYEKPAAYNRIIYKFLKQLDQKNDAV
jgi:pimeloyl-ACP methyl ester carboxylesterase